MLEILEWLVDKVESLLAFLSHWHVKAAKFRLRNLKEVRHNIQHSLIEAEADLNKVENQIIRIEEFLNQQYKEL